MFMVRGRPRKKVVKKRATITLDPRVLKKWKDLDMALSPQVEMMMIKLIGKNRRKR